MYLNKNHKKNSGHKRESGMAPALLFSYACNSTTGSQPVAPRLQEVVLPSPADVLTNVTLPSSPWHTALSHQTPQVPLFSDNVTARLWPKRHWLKPTSALHGQRSPYLRGLWAIDCKGRQPHTVITSRRLTDECEIANYVLFTLITV